MEKILYLGRFQPLHKGHLKTIRIVERDFKREVLPVVFTYELGGKHFPFEDCPFSFEEIRKMFNSIGIEPYKFCFNLENYYEYFYPSNIYRKRKELMSLGKHIITRDPKELPLMKILGLHTRYLPFAHKEEVIRSSTIRKLIYEGKLEEAVKYVPDLCADIFKEIVKNKNFELTGTGLRVGAFKFPRPII